MVLERDEDEQEVVGEISILADVNSEARGVDSAGGVEQEEAERNK